MSENQAANASRGIAFKVLERPIKLLGLIRRGSDIYITRAAAERHASAVFGTGRREFFGPNEGNLAGLL